MKMIFAQHWDKIKKYLKEKDYNQSEETSLIFLLSVISGLKEKEKIESLAWPDWRIWKALEVKVSYK